MIVKLSLLLHAIAIVLTLADPSLWRWTLGAIVANHMVLFVLALMPRGRLLGPNVSRLPAESAARGHVALTIDDGPDPDVTPKVLDILDAHGARATFFCVGAKVAAHPELARDIIRRGHAIESHTEHHRWYFAFFSVGAIVRELDTAQRSIADITGTPPALFRAPAGVRSPFLERVLQRLGLQLVSWTRRGLDTIDHNPDSVLRRLVRGLAGGDILLLHDGHPAQTRDGTPVILAVLPRLLEAIRAAGLESVTLRPAIRPAGTIEPITFRSAIQ